jgi:hypothetical protein
MRPQWSGVEARGSTAGMEPGTRGADGCCGGAGPPQWLRISSQKREEASTDTGTNLIP